VVHFKESIVHLTFSISEYSPDHQYFDLCYLHHFNFEASSRLSGSLWYTCNHVRLSGFIDLNTGSYSDQIIETKLFISILNAGDR